MVSKMWWDENIIGVKHKPMNEKDCQVILAFAENNMKLQATANALGRNYDTVAWRIARINAITGLDPRNFYDLIKLVDMANNRLGGNEDG